MLKRIILSFFLLTGLLGGVWSSGQVYADYTHSSSVTVTYTPHSSTPDPLPSAPPSVIPSTGTKQGSLPKLNVTNDSWMIFLGTLLFLILLLLQQKHHHKEH